MPSIRVKGVPYIHIEDIFNDHDGAPSNINEGASALQSQEYEQLALSSRSRPISMPNLKEPTMAGAAVSSPTSLNIPGSTLPRRPRSHTASSLILDHVLNSKRAPRSSRASAKLQPPASPSTAALNPDSEHTFSSPQRPGVLRLQVSLPDIVTAADGDSGILENAFGVPESENLSCDGDHHDGIVEHLDVIDSQVGTVSSLTNAANSILLPPLGLSRKPTIVLSSPTKSQKDEEQQEFHDALDRHVDDLLKRPSKVRRTLLGVWSFLKTPMGILTGIYGFLVVFWGAAIVFFLGKLINLHNANTQGFWVEVSSQVVCGLFTVTGIGFIPSRVLSTYRIYKIWRFKRETVKRRKAAGLPQLLDVDDLPDPLYNPDYVHVLTDEEQRALHRQQIKFAYHQTWYRPHGTETHRAFPINTALWICVLNDGNSIFQILLCGTMWGLNRFQRPAWSTGTLIPAGFLCGIGSAVLIWRGGEKTKRVEEVRERLRAALQASEHRLPSGEKTPSGPKKPEVDHAHRPSVRFDDRNRARDTISNEEPGVRVDEEMTIPKTTF